MVSLHIAYFLDCSQNSWRSHCSTDFEHSDFCVDILDASLQWRSLHKIFCCPSPSCKLKMVRANDLLQRAVRSDSYHQSPLCYSNFYFASRSFQFNARRENSCQGSCQEFDWVIALVLTQYCIPDFRINPNDSTEASVNPNQRGSNDDDSNTRSYQSISWKCNGRS